MIPSVTGHEQEYRDATWRNRSKQDEEQLISHRHNRLRYLSPRDCGSRSQFSGLYIPCS